MGFSRKSHGKRTDKETQSPMLKIFKDIMQKETNDPEKANLLKDSQTDRNKKHYLLSRSKSHHVSNKSSSSERQKQHSQAYNMEQEDGRNSEYQISQSQSVPYQSEKQDSWWFKKDTDSKSKGDDTCSCVSCALRKLISSDYACIVCLSLLLLVSGVIAIMLIYKSIPCVEHVGERMKKTLRMHDLPKTENDRLKRKIESSIWNYKPKRPWTNPFLKIKDPSFGNFRFEGNDMSSLIDIDSDLSKYLDVDKINEIQNSNRLKDFYQKLMATDAAIRNLRKTLNEHPVPFDNFETNSNNYYNRFSPKNYELNNYFNNRHYLSNNLDYNNNDMNNIDLNNLVLNYPDRLKRSIRLFQKPIRLFHIKRNENVTKSEINHGKLITKTTINMTANKKQRPNTNLNKKQTKANRNKRFGNYSDAEGIVIEKDKFVIQYRPSRIVPKCSHLPNDVKSHEKQQTHPFYKNTQRLDELLDQFMYKKLPDIFPENFDLNSMLDNNKNYKYPEAEDVIIIKDDDKPHGEEKGNQVLEPVSKFIKVEMEPKEKSRQIPKTENNASGNDFLDDSESVDVKTEKSSTTSYDILLSISTILNPAQQKTVTYPTSAFENRNPGLRKLMQVNSKDDEGVAYEDLKEVLSDYTVRDDEDKNGERKKRNLQILPQDKHLQDTNNPNWKGSMPLYPEELTQVIKEKQEQPDPNNKMDVPIHNRDSAPETDDAQSKLTDVEYVEDYLDNGYERLVELAQAYSDYGVLNEKKDTENENGRRINGKGEHKLSMDDKRVRLAIDGFKSSLKRGLKSNGIFRRSKKGSTPTVVSDSGANLSEGIRIELHPTTTGREDGPINIKKIIGKHFRITEAESPKVKDTGPILVSSTGTNFFHIPFTQKLNSEKKKLSQDYDSLSNVVLKKRSLKAVEFGNDGYDPNEDNHNDNNPNGNNNVMNTVIENNNENNDDNGNNNVMNIVVEKNNENDNDNSHNGNNNVMNIIVENNNENHNYNSHNGNNNVMNTVIENNNENIDDNGNNNVINTVVEKNNENDNDNSHNENNNVMNTVIKNNDNFETYKTKFRREIDNFTNSESNETKFERNYEDLNDSKSNETVLDVNVKNISNFDSNIIKFKRDINDLITEEKGTNHSDKVTEDNDKIAENPLKINQTDPKDNFTLSDLFQLFSNFFFTLDGLESLKNETKLNITSSNDSVIENKNEKVKEETYFPQYDADMIENIGHRSRVLLSIDDITNNTEKAEKKSNDQKEQVLDVSSSTEPMKTANVTEQVNKLTTNQKRDLVIETTTNNHKVKRQAIDDSNLIFWNDLYDDEYGIQVDPLENNIRDKHSVDRKDFIKRSNTWLQDKVKTISKKFNMAGFSKRSRPFKSDEKADSVKIKRNAKSESGEENNNEKIDFTALTAKMKDVCKKTAEAVYKQINHVNVREESKQGHVATSLMQQLVHLMTDLVDFQVKERTCRKLPTDLRNFLEWLTSTKEGLSEYEDYLAKKKESEHPGLNFDKSTEHDLLLPSESEDPDAKTDCLGTLHAVQDLLRQYDDMTDDDKSVMTGVKDYLEHQKKFLQKQLSMDDEKTLYNHDTRFKRDVVADLGHTVANTVDATAQQLEAELKELEQRCRCCMKKLLCKTKQVANKKAYDAYTAASGYIKNKLYPEKCKCKCKPLVEIKNHNRSEKPKIKESSKLKSKRREMYKLNEDYSRFKNDPRVKKSHFRDGINRGGKERKRGSDFFDGNIYRLN